MYTKGEMVVYPIYGAGIIEDIQINIIDGENIAYYVLVLPIGELKILVAVENADKVGLRQVMLSNDLQNLMICTKNRPLAMQDNWNLRYKEHMEMIKSGNLQDIAEVFRNLRLREKAKGLSSAEKKMLSNVKQILLSEIMLSFEVERDKAEEILADCINC